MELWNGVSVRKRVAEVNMRRKIIEGEHPFSECITTMLKTPKQCLSKKCIIGLLIDVIEKQKRRRKYESGLFVKWRIR